ncbi:hypothetical protein CgunFtcFv8_019040 [Champsocephalus gunnari]|uniref:Uncharacterized protein n=1 Tax=Champsocephalus gunnari TaxID=52237 RepID=A0AAN8HND5_CHAGU|nr:hypothetical protein CgunFtcFv8_019040 [Champsocephalus gunnari]
MLGWDMLIGQLRTAEGADWSVLPLCQSPGPQLTLQKRKIREKCERRLLHNFTFHCQVAAAGLCISRNQNYRMHVM